jgi:hypothetical protein
METTRTVEECKRMLFKCAIKHGIAPKLISERLLSKDDKNDMLQGLVSFETLDCFVRVWKEQGMCNYADGTGKWYEHYNLYKGVGEGSPDKVAGNVNLPHRN